MLPESVSVTLLNDDSLVLPLDLISIARRITETSLGKTEVVVIIGEWGRICSQSQAVIVNLVDSAAL